MKRFLASLAMLGLLGCATSPTFEAFRKGVCGAKDTLKGGVSTVAGMLGPIGSAAAAVPNTALDLLCTGIDTAASAAAAVTHVAVEKPGEIIGTVKPASAPAPSPVNHEYLEPQSPESPPHELESGEVVVKGRVGSPPWWEVPPPVSDPFDLWDRLPYAERYDQTKASAWFAAMAARGISMRTDPLVPNKPH